MNLIQVFLFQISYSPICQQTMDELFLRFEHIPEQIFKELDFQSLMNARIVAPSWKQFIDNRVHQWTSIKNEIAKLEKNCGYHEHSRLLG